MDSLGTVQPDNESPARSILLIEDDLDFASDLLRMWPPPIQLRHVASGRAALRQMQLERPTVILLDLCLPRALAETDDEEGFRLLEHVRRRLKWRIPVIVLTRSTSSVARSRAIASGADAVLCKPIDVAELDHVFRALVELESDNSVAERQQGRDREGTPRADIPGQA